MRITVLGVKTLPAYAGADRVVERILENLPDEHEVTVYLVREQSTKLACTANRHFVYVPALRGKHLRAFSYFLLCTAHFLVKGGGDVIHVHNSDFGLFCLFLKLKPGIRVVGTFHGNPYERQKWGRCAKVFLRLSEWCFVRACDELTSVASSKQVEGRVVRYIPNGVEAVDRANPRPTSTFPYAQLGLRIGEYVLFACGRLDRTKGLHHLLAAYRQRLDAPTLLVIGDFGHDAAYSRRIQEEAQRDDRVKLVTELLDRETLFEVISSALVFVFPSEVEAMSMMLLEALSCHTLTVCSDIPENIVVVGEQYPYLFASQDPLSLANTLDVALASAASGVTDRHVGALVQRFRWDDIASRYERVYRSVAA